MARQLIVVLVVVLLELVDLEVAVLLQVELHPHVVLLCDVLEGDGDGQLLAVEVLVADALDGVAHVEVQLVHHVQQQPGRLNGIELVVDVRRSEAHESAELCQSAELSHQSAHAAVVPDEELGFPGVLGWGDDKISCCQHQHQRHGGCKLCLVGETQSEELADSQIIFHFLFSFYLNISTATVVSTESADSQNEALVTSLALAVD